MTKIKSEKANAILETEGRFEFRIEGHLIAKKAIMAAETEADERHAKELQELKDKAVALARITQGAMILDGYELEDSCVKYMNELIDELQKLNENE